MKTPLAVGFLGLGIMGSHMARRLVQAGHRVTVWNRTPGKTAPLTALGARGAANPKDAVRGAEAVFTMLTDGAAVEEVILGSEGALQRAEAGAVFVDTTTTSPATARKVGAALRERGIGFLDAPVTGLDVGARDGTLSIMVGGEKADLDRVRPLLDVLGKRITHFGPQGAGQTVKACNQILCCLNMVGIVEALHLAQGSGIDPALVVEALVPGAGGSWALNHFGTKIAKGDFAPGGRIALMLKDLRIIQEEAGRLGLPVEGCRVAEAYFLKNDARGERDLGTQAMFRALGNC